MQHFQTRAFFHYNPLLYPLFIGIAMENGSFIDDLYPNTKLQ